MTRYERLNYDQPAYQEHEPRKPRHKGPLAAFVGFIVLVGGGLVANYDTIASAVGSWRENGGATDLCSGPLGVNGICPHVDEAAARKTFTTIVDELRNKTEPAKIYTTYFMPGASSSREDDKKLFIDEFEPIDYLTMVGTIERDGYTDNYSSYVEVIQARGGDLNRADRNHNGACGQARPLPAYLALRPRRSRGPDKHPEHPPRLQQADRRARTLEGVRHRHALRVH